MDGIGWDDGGEGAGNPPLRMVRAFLDTCMYVSIYVCMYVVTLIVMEPLCNMYVCAAISSIQLGLGGPHCS
jgi:hypothetical protein